MIYLIQSSYQKNSAYTNRALAISKGLKELGIEHRNIAILPSRNFDKESDCLRYGAFEYMWYGRKTNWRFFNKLQFYIAYKFLSRWKFKRFLSKLSPCDIILNLSAATFLPDMVATHKGDIYLERTEHLLVSSQGFNTKEKQTFYYHICQKLKGIFVITQSLKQSYIEQGIDENRLHIINMMVDYGRFRGLKKETPQTPYIAYCGTVSNQKDGVNDLIRAFSIVADKNKHIQLYIIGAVPKADDKNENLRLIKEFGLEQRVVMTGVVPSETMPQILKDAEVLVLARPNNLQAQNGFPTKLGEYLLTENPVVITKTGDISLFLTDQKDALLATPGNYEEIAEKILWVLNNPSEAKKIGENGARVALQHFNYLTETRKIVNVINNETLLQ